LNFDSRAQTALAGVLEEGPVSVTKRLAAAREKLREREGKTGGKKRKFGGELTKFDDDGEEKDTEKETAKDAENGAENGAETAENDAERGENEAPASDPLDGWVFFFILLIFEASIVRFCRFIHCNAFIQPMPMQIDSLNVIIIVLNTLINQIADQHGLILNLDQCR
jgi:hypothetical protein